MKKKILITSGILFAIIALGIFNKAFSKKDSVNAFTEVRKGLFEITVSNSGELIAEKSFDIYGPDYNMAQNQQQEGNQNRNQNSGQRTQGEGQRSSQSGTQGGTQGGSQGGTQGGGTQGGGQRSSQGGGSQGGGQAVRSTSPGGGPGGGGGGGQARGGDFHMMDFKIQDIVPEGTIVKQGDYIAQLDRTNYENSLRDAEEALKTQQANLEMRILDTAVSMTSLRDEIKNQRYTVEEAIITLDQSKFEPPATIRKAETNLNKQQRSLEQLIKSYDLRKIKTRADINNQKLTLQGQEALVANLQNFLSQFTVRAPADGMVIYKKDRNGTKRKTGSSVNPFDNVVATLPDLSTLNSKIYVSEIEVTKVVIGQKVVITIDAFPDEVYTGKVIAIANIGETLPNSDAKMFEVQVKVEGTDNNLRPAMTSWNKIIIKSIPDATFIPLECVQAGTDSIPFVIKKNKTKQIVVLGEQNDKNIIVKQGLEPGTNIYVVPPLEFEKFRVTGEDLIATARESR
jgi:hypothetical protein